MVVYDGIQFRPVMARDSFSDTVQYGVFVHELSDDFGNGDGVIFNCCDVPEDSLSASDLLFNEYLDTAATDITFLD